MNVCMTHYAFYPTTGGVESHLLDLCAELVAQGHQVHALVGSREGSPARENMQGIEIHRLDLMNPKVLRQRKRALGVQEDVSYPPLQDELHQMYADFCDRHNIDVVHAHNFHHFLPEYGLALTELHREGLPTFLTVHEVWSEFICEDLLERTEWDAVITVSKHVEDGIRQQAPQLDNLRLVYHGIDVTDLFVPGEPDPKWVKRLGIGQRPAIIHPARMLPWKGVIYSVRAIELLRDEFPDIVLIVTDTDDIVDWIDELKGYKEEVLAEIQQRGLTDNVVTQPFPYVELPGVYNACRVVVYPTIGEEPFGLVPVEGMACGKPVVVTRSGGLVESVVEGKTGFIIDKKDPEALAHKIGMLLRNPELAAEMGRAGRRHAVESFSRQRMAQEVTELYEMALTPAGSVAVR